MQKEDNSWIVYLSTFPPRECGIATYTKDLVDTSDKLFFPREESKIIAMCSNGSNYKYPKSVIATIQQEEKDDYIKAAQKINNISKVKLVCIQHEFGIYGGENGDYLFYFLKEIKKPVAIVLHTVVPSSSEFFEKHKEILETISDYVRTIIVMTKTSLDILVNDYLINSDKISVIPHGIHASQYQSVSSSKKILELEEQTVLTTFGLLSSGKGIEYAIEAVAEIVNKFPNVVYHIIGITHPAVVKKEGEAYRNKLKNLISKLGIEKNVIFHNRYFSTREIIQFLRATDIYMSLSLDPNQAVSGTLSYALGTGRPVVSTAFAQAKEDVTNKIGRLVDFKNYSAISDAVIELLEDKALRIEMGRLAYLETRHMTWQNVAHAYMHRFKLIVPELRLQEKNIPKINLKQFIKLTDNFGMFQFAKLIEPDLEFGYTLDDNARALIAVVCYYEKFKNKNALKLAKIYLEFINYCFSYPGYNNYVNKDKSFNTERNTSESLDDSYARGIYALAVMAASPDMPLEFREKASKIFRKKFDINNIIHKPRTAAFYIKAISVWLDYDKNEKYKEVMIKYCEYLVGLYKKNSRPQWQWFENIMTYSNGVISESLFLAYKITGDQRYFNIAKSTTDFLVANSFENEVCVPIGQAGWFKKGYEKAIFDQQPEEVIALVLALKASYEATGDKQYDNLMKNAFNWFLGNNVLSQVVYDHTTGGSYDGVGEKLVNFNQGAESTISYLIARLAF
jgi:glycosyltransferase involved in cell wall biosynthesis